jgi:hypothetical protein
MWAGHFRFGDTDNTNCQFVIIPLLGTRIPHRIEMRHDGPYLLVGHLAIELIEDGPQICGA